MPVLAVVVPAFKLAVSVPAASGAVLVADRLERGRVVDCSTEAAAAGVAVGMTLAQAQACTHDAITVVDDPVRDRERWAEILEALDAASPIVEDAAEGTAYLEMAGIEGAPQHWLTAVRGALAEFSLPFRLGLGPDPFVARAAALTDDGTVWLDGAATRLAALSLDILEIAPADRERLRLLGIETLGALATLPHGPFVRRFGSEGARWHAQARAAGGRPLIPRPRRLRIERSLFGEAEAACEEQVLFALRSLVGRVVDDLILAGKRCARLVLELECENGELPAITARLAQPTAQAATLFEVLRARLEGLTLDAAVVGLRLRADELDSAGTPLGLFATDDPDPEILGVTIARLEAAFGDGAAQHARVVEGMRLETRFAYAPFTPAAVKSASPPVSAAPVLQYRPLDPRPIDVTMRAGMPAFVGTPSQAVLDAAGPWRADERWWDRALGGGERLQRDDYDVLLEDGALYRIARTDGNYWFLYGTYD